MAARLGATLTAALVTFAVYLTVTSASEVYAAIFAATIAGTVVAVALTAMARRRA